LQPENNRLNTCASFGFSQWEAFYAKAEALPDHHNGPQPPRMAVQSTEINYDRKAAG
jgi:hypothetical protein